MLVVTVYGQSAECAIDALTRPSRVLVNRFSVVFAPGHQAVGLGLGVFCVPCPLPPISVTNVYRQLCLRVLDWNFQARLQQA